MGTRGLQWDGRSTYGDAAHGERIYVTVNPEHKDAFKKLGGRYGHGVTVFHDGNKENEWQGSRACCWTCKAHATEPDPARHDCCTYCDRDYTIFFGREQAQSLKALDKSMYWRPWYWSNAAVRDDLEAEADVTAYLCAVHDNSAFADFDIDEPTYLRLRKEARANSASHDYENPNPGLHERTVKRRQA